MSDPLAAIDCGTNTIKLLVGTLPDGVVRASRMVRLGEGVDRTGRLSPAALERAFGALDEYAVLLREHGVAPERVRFCATSATRDASNAAVFAEGVAARLGVRPEVLSGAEEAALSFAGAVRHLDSTGEPVARPVLVVDIGGGSTELVLGDRVEVGPTSSHSMDVGSVRLHERHVRHDPPTPSEVTAIVTDVDAALDACPVPAAEAATYVGVAGTVTTVAAGVLGLAGYDREAIDRAVLDVAAVHAHVAELVAMTVEQRRALPWMHPGRADVIDAGALVLSRTLHRTRVPTMTVSTADILDGIAWSIG